MCFGFVTDPSEMLQARQDQFAAHAVLAADHYPVVHTIDICMFVCWISARYKTA